MNKINKIVGYRLERKSNKSGKSTESTKIFHFNLDCELRIEVFDAFK